MIAVAAPEKTGKTTTVAKVWEMLPGRKKKMRPRLVFERFGIVETKDGGKIGIASRGDTPDEIREWVGELIATDECDVILCTCHTDDPTYDTVIELAGKSGYELIFCSHLYEYRPLPERIALSKLNPEEQQEVSAGDVNLSEFSAECLIELIYKLIKEPKA